MVGYAHADFRASRKPLMIASNSLTTVLSAGFYQQYQYNSQSAYYLCCHGSCHFAAGFSTATTGFSTLLAVVVVVLLALCSAAIARFSTDLTQLSVQIRVANHKPSANITSISAITTELNALRHHLHHVTCLLYTSPSPRDS